MIIEGIGDKLFTKVGKFTTKTLYKIYQFSIFIHLFLYFSQSYDGMDFNSCIKKKRKGQNGFLFIFSMFILGTVWVYLGK